VKVLVTGGTGFVGSNLARRLVADGHEVFITGTRTENTVEGATLLECGFGGVDYSRLGGVEVVYHQAANNDTTCTDGDEMFHANVLGTGDLFDTMYDLGCRQFVYASSTAVYGDAPAPYLEDETTPNPLNVYAESKLRMERAVGLAFLYRRRANVVGLRYCNVYGPGECHKGNRSSMIRQLAVQILQKKRPKLFKDGTQRRDWIYVKDVVEANLLAGKWKKDEPFVRSPPTRPKAATWSSTAGSAGPNRSTTSCPNSWARSTAPGSCTTSGRVSTSKTQSQKATKLLRNVT
jgi:ADP-L-glycero-D-manno-heptose 6-epimerase